MRKNQASTKSLRKPLRDISNGATSFTSLKNKPFRSEVSVGDDALDRLLLVHSDLTALFRQIDELVVQACDLKPTSKQEKEEIGSFTHTLSDIFTTLKPWIPRIQKALSSPSPMSENQVRQSLLSTSVPPNSKDDNITVQSPGPLKMDSLVSPSPLVSWRGNCNVERGRQMFLLTPLPRSKVLSSKQHGFSRLDFDTIASYEDPHRDHCQFSAMKSTPYKPSNPVPNETGNTVDFEFFSPSRFTKRDCSLLVMTPCLKVSPPKSCVLLEPMSESTRQVNCRGRKSTPYPLGIREYSESPISEPSSSEVSGDMALKYPELNGIQPGHKLGMGRGNIEVSPKPFISPPKTCVLMEPPEETIHFTNYSLERADNVLNQPENLRLGYAYECKAAYDLSKKYNQELLGHSSLHPESTPACKEPASTIIDKRRPGENTLKKELWTKFEAASTNGIRFSTSVLQRETGNRGFLARLDEVSLEETGS